MADTEEKRPRFFQANVPVFVGSAALIFTALLLVVHDPDDASIVFAAIQSWIVHEMGWFYVAAVATFLVFAIGIAASSMGAIKLGPDDSEPDFSTASWFAMLFSAGMGIGIMFYGVAEPVLHFASPPVGEGGTVEAARNAMQLSFFHWGLHAWAIYAVMGLALAYFSFRQGLPLTVRSALYPLIGERIYGPIGHLVDIFAVFGTMFGVATSLGLGVLQVNAGLNYLFGIEPDISVQLMLIAGITLLATASVVSGINAGIRRLSELNLCLAIVLMLFVLAVGPTVFLLQAAMQNTGAYLSDLVGKTFTLYAYQPNEWIGGWTLFYWGWWISWSPFVGMFIARISRGRTIREFVIGVLLVPSGFTFLWFTVFGNTALAMQLDGSAQMVDAVQADVAVALFQFLGHLPFAGISMTIATLLVVTFFVTSSDSGSLVDRHHRLRAASRSRRSGSASSGRSPKASSRRYFCLRAVLPRCRRAQSPADFRSRPSSLSSATASSRRFGTKRTASKVCRRRRAWPWAIRPSRGSTGSPCCCTSRRASAPSPSCATRWCPR